MGVAQLWFQCTRSSRGLAPPPQRIPHCTCTGKIARDGSEVQSIRVLGKGTLRDRMERIRNLGSYQHDLSHPSILGVKRNRIHEQY
jgi:hypothetical protein